MKEQAKKTINESLIIALSNIDSNPVLSLETKNILKDSLTEQITTLLNNMDKEPESPILVDEIVEDSSKLISELSPNTKIAYLDHNVISKVANDPNLQPMKNKLLEMKNNGWLFAYSQTHLDETSLICKSLSLKDKSENVTILNILKFIKEICGNSLLDPLQKTIQTRSPIELFNTINDPICVNVANKAAQDLSLLTNAESVKKFRDHFKCQPKNINNCQDFREATNFINKKITEFGGQFTTQTGVSNLHEWILFNIKFCKDQNLIHYENNDYSYFTNKALLFEFFGYHAQNPFEFKTGLLADGVHGYISTLVNLFICDDNKLVKSLRDQSGCGINNTEILTIQEFQTKYMKDSNE